MQRSLTHIVHSYDAGVPLEQRVDDPGGLVPVRAESWTSSAAPSLRGRGSSPAAQSRFARPGQYVSCVLASGEPVVVVRGRDGVLRGFFNVCRHHAAAS